MSAAASSFDCCKAGSFHTGTPVGSETKVNGIQSYVSGPEDAKTAIFIIHDVFGWSFPNARLLADKYAKGTGARVYLPDLFSGEDLWTQTGGDLAKLQKEISIPDFLAKYPPRDAPNKTVEAYAAELKTKHEKLGVIGFCWGAPPTLHLGSKDADPKWKPDAVAFAHPSLTQDSDFENLDTPGTFLACEIDQQLTEEKRNRAIAITTKLANEKGLYTKWVYYPKVSHGWAVRSDPGDLYADRAAKDACNVIIAFFGTL